MCGIGSLFDDTGAVVDFKVPFCDRWDCETCFERRKARVLKEVLLGRPEKFLTLTISSKIGTSPVDRRAILARAFPLLMKRLHRFLGEKPEYFAICEAHKSGEPHIHVAMRCKYVPWKKLRAWWVELTGCPGVDIRKVWDRGGAAKYFAQYLKKGLAKYGNFKRYWQSQGWQLPPEEGRKVKEFVPRFLGYSKRHIYECLRLASRAGWWRVPDEPEPGVTRMVWLLKGAREPPPLAEVLR